MLIKLILGVFFMFPAFAEVTSNVPWENYTFVAGCSTYDFKFTKRREFPGHFCVFFDDGSFASATDTSIRMFAKDLSVSWEIPGYFHHQLNLSSDKQRILAISSKAINKGDKKVKIDVLHVFSKNGKTISEIPLNEVLNSDSLEVVHDTPPVLKHILDAEGELTHVNSFYEISDVSKSRSPYFKKGNFIANSLYLGAIVLNSDLSKVLAVIKIPSSDNHAIHDVQVEYNGDLLYLNNRNNKGTSQVPFSSVEAFDLRTKRNRFEITGEPKGVFFTECCGGVQRLDKDHILISHSYAGVFIYSLTSKRFVLVSHRFNRDNNTLKPVQDVKLRDLSNFFAEF